MKKPPNDIVPIPLTPGGRAGNGSIQFARMERVDRDRLAALGYKMDRLVLNSADERNSYVRQNAVLPDGADFKHQVARLIVALMLLEEKHRIGEPAKAKGWTAHYRDGDRLNLSRSNLERKDAGPEQRSNSYKALWDVRERARLAAEGKAPNAVFRARRPKKRKGKKDRNGPKAGAK